MDQHERYMLFALLEAQKAKELGEVPVGAVIVKEGQVLAACHNLRETANDPTAHAEVLAIREAAHQLSSRRLLGCTLYVTLEPCPMCAGAMLMAQIDTCFFGAWDTLQGCCGSVYDLPEDPAFSHRVKMIGGLLENQSKALLQDFFALRRV